MRFSLKIGNVGNKAGRLMDGFQGISERFMLSTENTSESEMTHKSCERSSRSVSSLSLHSARLFCLTW